jgi:hypothetical protein
VHRLPGEPAVPEADEKCEEEAMSWGEFADISQWVLIFFLFFKGVKNEVRIDRLEDKL